MLLEIDLMTQETNLKRAKVVPHANNGVGACPNNGAITY